MWVRRAAATASALGLVMLAAGAGAAPASAAGEWEETRNFKFSTAAIPEGCETYEGKYAAGANVWAKDDVRFTDGEMRLRLQARASGGQKYTAGGIGCFDWGQTFGRYEIRAIAPAGVGIDSALALWPTTTQGAENGWTALELGTPNTGLAFVTNGFGSGNFSTQTPGTYAGAMRTYTIEWRPNGTKVLVDGKEIFSDARSFTQKRWLGLSISTGDPAFGLPAQGTKLPVEFRIDSVRVWKYTGSAKAAAAPAPEATPSATAIDPKVPGSVVLETPAAASAESSGPSGEGPDVQLVAFAVAGALVTAGVAFAALRFFLRRS